MKPSRPAAGQRLRHAHRSVGRQVIQPDDVAWHQRAPKTCFTSARNPSAAVAPLTVITALDPLLVQRAQLGDSA